MITKLRVSYSISSENAGEDKKAIRAAMEAVPTDAHNIKVEVTGHDHRDEKTREASA